MTAFTFDATQVAPDEGRLGPMPAGWWPFLCDEVEMTPTKDLTGSYIKARFSCTEGPHKGSKVWHNFNVNNSSEKAVEIARKQLSAFMHAIGVLKIDALEQLKMRPLFLKIKFVPADGQYEAKNEINAFREINDAAAKAGYQAQLTGAPAAAKGSAIPPAKAGAAIPPAPGAAAAVPPAPGASPAPGSWNPGAAAAQPWNGAEGNAAPAPAATATAPATSTATQTSAPAAVEQVPQAWGNAAPSIPAQTTIAPAPTVTHAASPEASAAPAGSDDLPPWMTDEIPD